MKKNAAELASRWLKRDISHLSEAERNVLKARPSARRYRATPTARSKANCRWATGSPMRSPGSAARGRFILSFLAFLVVWAAANVWLLGRESFDPYPFIFLNLLLSMLAALQAPVIMMSQNRQAERDRIDAAHDYEVNLKAEIEIMALHEKLDELRHQEMMAMREDIRKIADELRRLGGGCRRRRKA